MHMFWSGNPQPRGVGFARRLVLTLTLALALPMLVSGPATAAERAAAGSPGLRSCAVRDAKTVVAASQKVLIYTVKHPIYTKPRKGKKREFRYNAREYVACRWGSKRSVVLGRVDPSPELKDSFHSFAFSGSVVAFAHSACATERDGTISCPNGFLKVVDIATGKTRATWRAPANSQGPRTVVLSPNGTAAWDNPTSATNAFPTDLITQIYVMSRAGTVTMVDQAHEILPGSLALADKAIAILDPPTADGGYAVHSILSWQKAGTAQTMILP